MKAYQVVPGIIGGLAAFAVLKYGNDNPAAMAGIGFAIAFGLCCHHAKAITLRGVIAGVITIPASMAAMAMLNMDLSPAPGQGWIESGWVLFILIFWIFAAASYPGASLGCKRVLAAALPPPFCAGELVVILQK